jgi:hypothetical protein
VLVTLEVTEEFVSSINQVNDHCLQMLPFRLKKISDSGVEFVTSHSIKVKGQKTNSNLENKEILRCEL